jgi:23S rRNA pseudouridine2604 synthase
MVHSPMRYAAAAITIITVVFDLVAAEQLKIIPTAVVVAFTPPPRAAAFRSSLIHADVSTYHHHRHPLNNVLLLLKRRDAIIKSSNNNRTANNEDDAFRQRTKLTAEAPNSSSDNNKEDSEEGIRLNKVFKATHSRRAADKLIEEGRVTINGRRVHDKGGYKVIPYRDVITLDGKVVTGWEQINAIAPPTNNQNHRQQQQKLQRHDDQQQHQQQHEYDSNSLQTSSFEYVKYYKPLGVTCTTDLRIKDNIIHSIQSYGYKSRHRVYPIGRLDKETSGLILLTSDGRIVNSVLRGERKQPKIYKVKVDGLLDDTHLQRLRDGIVIRTVAQRKNKSLEENTLIAKTKPCKVQRIGPSAVQMTLVEGRNRQIRKMMEAIGFTVVRLHRVEFMGIKLSRGLEVPGDWDYLDKDEMELVKAALRSDY